MGSRTDAARQEVLARREVLVDEVGRLQAAGRAAVDIPAKVRRQPARTAGLAAGSAFLLAGGPQRLFRRVRRAVRGPDADLPPSLLPKQVDKALRSLGDDGRKVRGTLEREFADYLDAHRKERSSRDLGAVLAGLVAAAGRPVATRLGRRLAEQLAEPDAASFQRALERIRGRQAAEEGTARPDLAVGHRFQGPQRSTADPTDPR